MNQDVGKRVRVVLMMGLILGMGLALGWDQMSMAQEMAMDEPSHTFEVGTEISHFTYKEDSIDETGWMYGVVGAYTFRDKFSEKMPPSMVKVDGKVSFGKVDYDGQLQDGTPYTIDNIDDVMFEVRGVVGPDFMPTETVTLTPYFGFGYRYLNDDLAKDPAGYERESNYFYSPLGLEASLNISDQWSIGALVEYDIFWFGTQKSHLSDAVTTLSDIENDQESGYGLRGAISVKRESEKVNVIVEPFVRYWDIDESERVNITVSGTIIGTAVEPKNHSTEYGVKIALEF